MIYSPDSFVRYKDLPNLNSIFGNIGNSWNNPFPNDLYIKGVPKDYLREAPTTPSGNVGGGEDTILSATFVAKTFKSDTDYAEGEVGGALANNANSKTVTFYVNSVAQGILVVNGGDQGWFLRFKIIRVSATKVRVGVLMMANVLRVDGTPAITLSTGFSAQADYQELTVSNLDSNNLDWSVTAQGTNNNDITKAFTTVRVTRQ